MALSFDDYRRTAFERNALDLAVSGMGVDLDLAVECLELGAVETRAALEQILRCECPRDLAILEMRANSVPWAEVTVTLKRQFGDDRSEVALRKHYQRLRRRLAKRIGPEVL